MPKPPWYRRFGVVVLAANLVGVLLITPPLLPGEPRGRLGH